MEKKLSLNFRFYLVVCNRRIERNQGLTHFRRMSVSSWTLIRWMACRFTVLHGFLDEKQTGQNIFKGTRWRHGKRFHFKWCSGGGAVWINLSTSSAKYEWLTVTIVPFHPGLGHYVWPFGIHDGLVNKQTHSVRNNISDVSYWFWVGKQECVALQSFHYGK